MVRQRPASTCGAWQERRRGYADLFGRARKAGRLGWVERRRAESRTRFKRKVLRVNGAEVMPRPQQQQPPSLAPRTLSLSLFLSFARSFRSPLRARTVFSLFRSSHPPFGLAGGKRESVKLPFSRGFSPLLKHTLSSCLLSFRPPSLSFSLASSLVGLPPQNAAFSLHPFAPRPPSFLVVFSHTPRDGSIFFSRNSHHGQSLTSASNASCRRTSPAIRTYSPCARAPVYISIRRHLLSAFS